MPHTLHNGGSPLGDPDDYPSHWDLEGDDPTFEPGHVLDEGDEEYAKRTTVQSTAASLFGPYTSEVAW